MSFSFGTTNTTANTTPSFSFGSTTAPAAGTGVSFGAPAVGTTGLQFNAPATSQPNTGLTFGAPTTTSNFSFGGSTGGSLSFGTATTTTNTGLGFKPPVGGLSFGTTPQTSLPLGTTSTPTTWSGLTFGNTAQAPSTTTQAPLSFGITPIAQPTTATTTTGALAFGATPSFNAQKPTLSFGTSTTSSTTPATGLFSFSTAKTTAGTGFTLTTSAAGTGLFSTPTTQPTSTPPAGPFKGLGGVDTSQSLSGSGNQSDNKCVKDNLIPNEIVQTTESFKTFLKQQKNLHCEMSRASVKPIKKVMEDTESLKQLLSSINSLQQKNRTLINKLKTDTSKCLVQCEMAQRTHDTPIGLQNDNLAPLEFFIGLVSKFERDVQDLRQEIDNTEKHVKSLSQPAALSPQELSVALKHLHDSFVALAGRLQTAHTQVMAQKERHLSLRRHIIKDSSNIFQPSEKREIIPRKTTFQATASPGPTPFSSMGNTHSMNLMSYQDTSVSPFQTSSLLSGWASNAAPNISGTQNSFLQSSSNTLGSTPTTDNQNFQLLKPPLGNKRGKR